MCQCRSIFTSVISYLHLSLMLYLKLFLFHSKHWIETANHLNSLVKFDRWKGKWHFLPTCQKHFSRNRQLSVFGRSVKLRSNGNDSWWQSMIVLTITCAWHELSCSVIDYHQLSCSLDMFKFDIIVDDCFCHLDARMTVPDNFSAKTGSNLAQIENGQPRPRC